MGCVSIFPEILKPLGTALGVAHGMRDVPMVEVLLDRSRIVIFVLGFGLYKSVWHLTADVETTGSARTH